MALGTELSYDPAQPIARDGCPDVLWVEIQNPRAIFARGAFNLQGSVGPILINDGDENALRCDRPFTLLTATDSGGGFVTDPPLSSTGVLTGGCDAICIQFCDNVPSRTFLEPELSSGDPIRFGLATGNHPATRLFIFAEAEEEPPT